MRKLLIKLFFGPVDIKGRFIDRLAFWNIAAMLKVILLQFSGYPLLAQIAVGGTILFFLIFTFPLIKPIHYFTQKPVHWDELTKIQRFYYGSAYEKMPYLKKPQDLQDNWNEFIKIKIFYIAKYNK